MAIIGIFTLEEDDDVTNSFKSSSATNHASLCEASNLLRRALVRFSTLLISSFIAFAVSTRTSSFEFGGSRLR